LVNIVIVSIIVAVNRRVAINLQSAYLLSISFCLVTDGDLKIVVRGSRKEKMWFGDVRRCQPVGRMPIAMTMTTTPMHVHILIKQR